MKIGIVGAGMVGATAAYAMVMRGVGRQIVLVDLNQKRSAAEANDLFHAVPFANPLQITAGSYADLAGSRVVILAAGVAQRPGESRLHLLGRNAAVFRDVVPRVLKHAADAVLVVATNPVDIMTHLATIYATQAGHPANRVLGSGTTLDTARFRTLLGAHFGVDPQHVHAYVVGEHGDTEVLTWSTATIAGMRLDQLAAYRDVPFDEQVRQRIDHRVRHAAYEIIEGKGATYYGVGSALARITGAILYDQRAILTVSSRLENVAGVADVTLSLPHLISGSGLVTTLPLKLDEAEQKALAASAHVIRQAIDSLNEI